MRLPKHWRRTRPEDPHGELLMFRTMAVCGVLALAVCALCFWLSRPAAGQGLIYRSFMPVTIKPATVYPLKGSAGCYTDGSSWVLGITHCYNFYKAYEVPELGTLDYEVVPMIQIRTAGFTEPFEVDYAGQYWLLCNECDNYDSPNTSDGITPTLGAQILWTVANQVEPQGARIVCCKTLFGGAWLGEMFAEYARLYGGDARSRIAAYSFSIYAVLGTPCWTDACILAHYEWQLDRALAWVAEHDAGKQVWAAETGWTPINEPSWEVAIAHARLICPAIKSRPFARYNWYSGLWTSWDLNQQYMSLMYPDKTLSPLGQVYRDEC